MQKSGHQPPPGDPGTPPSFTPPPKRIYNIVEPSTLARVYAAAYSSTDGYQDLRRARAGEAVRDFIKLMREEYHG